MRMSINMATILQIKVLRHRHENSIFEYSQNACLSICQIQHMLNHYKRKGCNQYTLLLIGHATPVAIIETTTLVPYIQVKATATQFKIGHP